MLQELRAGASLELLTGDELTSALDPLHKAMQKANPRLAPIVRRLSHRAQADTSGNITAASPYFRAFRPGVGTYVSIQRITIMADGYTPGTPLSGGWVTFNRNDDQPSTVGAFVPVGGSSVVAPALITDGDSAMVLIDGETLCVNAGGLPPSQWLTIGFQLRLWEQPTVAKLPPILGAG